MIKHLTKEKGINDNIIWATYIDKHQNLWLGMNNGISVVNISSPFSSINDKFGLGITTYSLMCSNQKLYAGTANGLFIADKLDNRLSVFKADKIITGQIWDILDTKDEIIIATSSLIWAIDKKTKLRRKLSAQQNLWKLQYSKNDSSKIYAYCRNGIYVLKKKQDKYYIKTKLKNFDKDIRYVKQTDSATWFSDVTSGICKLTINNESDSVTNIKWYGKNKGLPSNSNNYLRIIDNNLIITTEKGVYKYNEKIDSFHYYNKFAKVFNNENIDFKKLTEDDFGNIFFMVKNNLQTRTLMGLLSKIMMETL